MLNQMREKANSWIMMILFATIIFVFALNFGPWAGQTGQNTKTYAAIVNGEVVSLSDFQFAYSNMMRQMQRFRPDFSSEQAEKENLRGLVVERLISMELLAQLARQNDLMIPNTELATMIKKQFTGESGVFDIKEYKRILNGVFQITESSFENLLKREMLAEKMSSLLLTGVDIDSSEVKSNFELKNNKVSLNYYQVNPKDFSTPKSNQKALENYIKDHSSNITDYYQNNLTEFRSPKKVDASHILVKFSKGADKAEKEKSLNKAQDILKKVKTKKADFAKLAKKYSDDGSAKKGGNLGFFGRGTMVKPFEDKAFSMNAGETSDIVESPFGYHIIKVNKIKETLKQELDDPETKKLIAQKLVNQKYQADKAQSYAESILAKLNKNPKSDPKFSRSKTQKTKLFAQNARFLPKIGLAENIISAAFGLTKKTPVYNKVLKSGDKYYVIKLNKSEKPDMKKFETDKVQLRKNLLAQRQRQYLKDYRDFLTKKAKITYNDALFVKKGA